MPITIRWFDDTKQIVLWEFKGQWTLDELHTIYTESHDMCMTVPENTVNALVDMTRSPNGIPSSIFSTLTARRRTEAPNFDMVVIVSNSTLIKVFVNVMDRMPSLHDHFRLVLTREDGLAFIEKRRQEQELGRK
jgi:hypothetical protein